MIAMMLALQAAAPPPVTFHPRVETYVLEALRPMEFLVGSCWTGEVAPNRQDTHCFDVLYNGMFIRDRHVVRNGPQIYEGETIYAFEPGPRGVTWTYWASDGSISRGTMTPRTDGGPGILDFGTSTSEGPASRSITITTTWAPAADGSGYEVRWTSPTPQFNRTIRYVRTEAAPVVVSEAANLDGTRRMTHEVVIAAPPAAVYAAFAGPDGWRRWAAPHVWAVPGDTDLMETSYDPAATLGNPANIQQRFLARVPDRLVVFRTVRTPPGFPEAEAYVRTTTIAEIEPEGGGTRLRLTTTGYPAGASGDRLIAFFRDANRMTLEGLRRVLAPTP